MGLIDKIKNLFTEEIEEDTKPIKKEVIQVEIPSPKKEENIEKDITESEAIKKDEKFVFPVYFDEKDFDTLEPKPEPPKQSSYVLNKQGTKEKEEKKFKHPQIISPFIGVLDKNYKKEDIMPKRSQKVEQQTLTREITIDDVRKKAFGTLEEELEAELFSQNSMLFNDKIENEEEETIEKDSFEELEESQEDIISKEVIEEEITLEIFEENDEPKEEKEEVNMVEDELDKLLDKEENEEESLSEGDLFDLIDSMYEKGEDN